MPRVAKELTAIEVKRLKAPGFHSVGGVSGLHLRINGASGRSWILRAVVGSKRRDIGLGGYPSVSLSEARDKARACKIDISAGADPVEDRKKAREDLIASQIKGKTFADAVNEFLSSGTLDGLRNEKHRDQWGSTLGTYAVPLIGGKSLDEITVNDVKSVLAPIWLDKHETAKRLRGRIEKVLDWATVTGHRSGENPARWKGNLSEVLSKPRKELRSDNHPALPVDLAPTWYLSLCLQEGIAAKALCFLALTASRSGEVRGATWSELDLDKGMWTVSAKRMKAGREHRVPLSQAAVSLLGKVPRFPGSEHVFPSSRGGALSDMALSAVMRRMHQKEIDAKRTGWLDARNGRPAVPHGLRSTFRDWVAERTDFPRDLAEIALAHQVGSDVERAYRRSDMFEKRRNMMIQWSEFLTENKEQDS